MFQTIIYEVDNAIAKITINRPEVSNALGAETYAEITQALETANAQEDVRVVIITGIGKNFSAGGDVKQFKGWIEDRTYITAEGVETAGAMARAVKTCWKPVIAMVNGAAAGAAASLALACDYRVMDSQSSLIMAFINLGLSGDTGAMYLLSRMVGTARASEIMASGRPIGAAEAKEIGLTEQVVETGKLVEATDTLANKLATMPTQALARQKKLSYEFFFSEMERFAKREGQYMYETSQTADFAEAVDAFLEKRPPHFTGK